MKKIWLLGLFVLGGCNTLSTLESASLTTTQVYVASSAFDAAEVTATNYLQLPPCPLATVCRTPAAVTAVVAAGRGGITARRTLVAACQASTSAPACVSAYTTLTTVVTAMQHAFSEYAIQKGS